MQAVILAAGKSNRFYPFTSYPHKSLVSLLNKSLLNRTLESLHKANITDVIIVVAKGSPIPDVITPIKGVSLRFVQQIEAKGMGDALLSAKAYLMDSFILLSAYHFECASAISKLVKAKNEKHDVVLLAKEDALLEEYGVLEVKGNEVRSIVEKPSIKMEKGLRVIGMYLLSKAFLSVLKDLPSEQYHFEKALDIYAKKGRVGLVHADFETITLKYAWDLLAVKDLLLKTLRPYVSKKAFIAENAILSGPVYVSDGVQILEGACIKGPCFLGENVIVGNNAILRNGVIVEKNVVIGATMEVKNSIIFEGVTTHTGFVGDSIIGKDTKIAAGFLTANVRLDRKAILSEVREELVNTHRTHAGVIAGENSNFGVTVTVMPGIIVGNRVTVGPSTVVMETIDDNTTFYTKFETVVKKKPL